MLIILHSKQDSLAQYFIFLKMSVHTLIKPLHVVISDTGRLFFRNFLLKCTILPKKGFLCFVSYLSQVDKIYICPSNHKKRHQPYCKVKMIVLLLQLFARIVFLLLHTYFVTVHATLFFQNKHKKNRIYVRKDRINVRKDRINVR